MIIYYYITSGGGIQCIKQKSGVKIYLKIGNKREEFSLILRFNFPEKYCFFSRSVIK